MKDAHEATAATPKQLETESKQEGGAGKGAPIPSNKAGAGDLMLDEPIDAGNVDL